jgi:hypothetical protein
MGPQQKKEKQMKANVQFPYVPNTSRVVADPSSGKRQA